MGSSTPSNLDFLPDNSEYNGKQEGRQILISQRGNNQEQDLKTKARKPITAALLSSVIPGLGQVYNGQPVKGILFYLATFLFVILLSFTGLQYSFYGLMTIILLALFLWLFIVVESFIAAGKVKSSTLKPYNKWYVYLIIVLLSFGIDLALTDFFVKDVLGIRGFRILTDSMLPTLQKGDCIMTRLKDYKSRLPQRGDLVIIKDAENPSQELIRRVVGLEGEKFEIKNKRVFINNRPLQEDYKIHTDSSVDVRKLSLYDNSIRDNCGPLIVPWGHCFVLGDNRDNSRDSRHWGSVSLEDITAKALYIYLSADLIKIGRNLR